MFWKGTVFAGLCSADFWRAVACADHLHRGLDSQCGGPRGNPGAWEAWEVVGSVSGSVAKNQKLCSSQCSQLQEIDEFLFIAMVPTKVQMAIQKLEGIKVWGHFTGEASPKITKGRLVILFVNDCETQTNMIETRTANLKESAGHSTKFVRVLVIHFRLGQQRQQYHHGFWTIWGELQEKSKSSGIYASRNFSPWCRLAGRVRVVSTARFLLGTWTDKVSLLFLIADPIFFFCQGTRDMKFLMECDGINSNSSYEENVPVWHLRSRLKMFQANKYDIPFSESLNSCLGFLSCLLVTPKHSFLRQRTGEAILLPWFLLLEPLSLEMLEVKHQMCDGIQNFVIAYNADVQMFPGEKNCLWANSDQQSNFLSIRSEEHLFTCMFRGPLPLQGLYGRIETGILLHLKGKQVCVLRQTRRESLVSMLWVQFICLNTIMFLSCAASWIAKVVGTTSDILDLMYIWWRSNAVVCL